MTSWEEHFFKVRRWFFAARSPFIIGAGFRTSLLLDKSILESPTPISIPLLILCTTGFLFPSRRLHGILAAVTMGLIVMGVSYSRLAAGAR
jgi:hypothetical protein